MPLKQKYHLVNYMLTVAQSPKLKLVQKKLVQNMASSLLPGGVSPIELQTTH